MRFTCTWAAVAPEGVVQPADESQQGHGCGHAQVGDHLPVIGAGVGDIAVDQAEDHRQRLAHGIALGVEQQRGDADERGGQSEVPGVLQQEEGQQDGPHRGTPKELFLGGEIVTGAAQHDDFLLSDLKKSIRPRIF